VITLLEDEMMNLRSTTFLTIIFVASSFAQSSDVTKEPGYVDFGNLAQFENSTGVTEVTIDEDLLSTLAEMSDDQDPNIMHILRGLKLVKANVYDVNENNRKSLESKITSIDAKLSGSNWKRIVRTRKQDDIANVYIKQNGKKQVVGLVVTSLEGSDEAAFVNIVGTIDLKSIGRLGKKFNIPQLEGVDDHEK
jgi:Domain of unknown function (DUF4252)